MRPRPALTTEQDSALPPPQKKKHGAAEISSIHMKTKWPFQVSLQGQHQECREETVYLQSSLTTRLTETAHSRLSERPLANKAKAIPQPLKKNLHYV